MTFSSSLPHNLRTALTAPSSRKTFYSRILSNHFFKALALSVCLVPLYADAENKYSELPRSAWLTTENKVEVMELFSYGCSFCYSLEPIINPWIEQLPQDVRFSRVPAMFGGIWDTYGQLYFTLESLDVDQSVHAAVFEAVHAREPMATAEDMAKFLAGHGVDPEVFFKTFNSFAIQSKMNEARRKTVAFAVTGVPALVVNGKYRFDQTAGGASGMLSLADELIEKERTSH